MPKNIDVSKIQYEGKTNINGYLYSEIVSIRKIETMPAEDVKSDCGAEMEMSNSNDKCSPDEANVHRNWGINWYPID